MGYVIPSRTVTLEMPEPYVGAEIEVEVSISFDLLEEAMSLSEDVDGEASFKDKAAAYHRIGEIFLGKVVSWNLEDRHGPIPTDMAGWKRLDLPIQIAVIRAWLAGVVEMPLPLGERSGGTTPSGSARASRRRAK